MKKKNILSMLTFLATFSAWAQTPDSIAMQYAESLTIPELRSHLEVLTSDSLEGRETGAIGQKRAAAYLRDEFKQAGLQPGNPQTQSYYQPYALEKSSWQDVYLKHKQGMLTHLQDMIYYGGAVYPEETAFTTTFVGEGKASDYAGLDIKGKLVLIYDTENDWRAKYAEAQQHGAAGAIIGMASEEADFKHTLEQAAHYLNKPRLSLKKGSDTNARLVFFVSAEAAVRLSGTSEKKLKKLMAKKAAGKLASYTKLNSETVRLKAQRNKDEVTAENVVAYIEGSDLKEELLIITAHYDHIGKGPDGEIFRGADDDASGTATVVEIAEAFAQAKAAGHGPRRSMLFMTVSGEEKGLLGSEYYTSHPLYPLKNTVTNLNIDMIGRIDPAHEGNPEYIYLIGSDKLSAELHQLSEATNKTYTQLALDYTYNDENDPNRYYYRSDHYNFAKNNVPVIFYFNGTHADYHKSTDTIEKINFEKMQKIGRLVFFTAWELANRDKRPALNTSLSSE